MFNQAIVMGFLGQDPELRFTADGTPVASMSIATTKKWTDKSGEKKEQTEWHRVNVWGAQAENCSKYLKKGSPVQVVGELNTRSYEGKDNIKRYVTEIRAHSVTFLPSSGTGSKPPHAADAAPAASGGSAASQSSAAHDNPSLDDIPF